MYIYMCGTATVFAFWTYLQLVCRVILLVHLDGISLINLILWSTAVIKEKKRLLICKNVKPLLKGRRNFKKIVKKNTSHIIQKSKNIAKDWLQWLFQILCGPSDLNTLGYYKLSLKASPSSTFQTVINSTFSSYIWKKTLISGGLQRDFRNTSETPKHFFEFVRLIDGLVKETA